MPMLKRATKKLHDLGYPHLSVHRGLWGYSARDDRFRVQRGRVSDTAQEVIDDVLSGIVPVEVKEDSADAQE